MYSGVLDVEARLLGVHLLEMGLDGPRLRLADDAILEGAIDLRLEACERRLELSDLLTDRYNLSGSDTGHRAWLLSTRLSKISVGAAYGTNGYRYSVNQVLNVGDSARTASREMVAYPNAGVFPLEAAISFIVSFLLFIFTSL